MPLPQAPPFDRSTPGLLVLLAMRPELARAEQDGRYLHWEELKHRPVPAGVTREQWWQAIKLARQTLANNLPLVDAKDRPFVFGMTDSIYRQQQEIDLELKFTKDLPGEVNQARRKRYVQSSLIEEALRSSQLEGASTTRLVAKEMIRTKRTPRNNSERMVLNNFKALEWVRENRTNPLTSDAVFELHSIVTYETLETEDGAGRFRREDEDIRVWDTSEGEIIHTPPHAPLLPARLEAMCKFANGADRGTATIQPVVRAMLLHFWLAYDHPFVDGNGRTARALFYWSMLNQGYWLTEFVSISRAIKNARRQYEKAFLFAETDGNDATYFLVNQLKALRSAIDDLYEYLEHKAEETDRAEALLRGRVDLNERQLALLSHALRHSDARYTFEEHQASHGVVYETARTDIVKLVRAGFLEQVKIGKKLYFTPVRSLDRKLQKKR